MSQAFLTLLIYLSLHVIYSNAYQVNSDKFYLYIGKDSIESLSILEKLAFLV